MLGRVVEFWAAEGPASALLARCEGVGATRMPVLERRASAWLDSLRECQSASAERLRSRADGAATGGTFRNVGSSGSGGSAPRREKEPPPEPFTATGYPVVRDALLAERRAARAAREGGGTEAVPTAEELALFDRDVCRTFATERFRAPLRRVLSCVRRGSQGEYAQAQCLLAGFLLLALPEAAVVEALLRLGADAAYCGGYWSFEAVQLSVDAAVFAALLAGDCNNGIAHSSSAPVITHASQHHMPLGDRDGEQDHADDDDSSAASSQQPAAAVSRLARPRVAGRLEELGLVADVLVPPWLSGMGVGVLPFDLLCDYLDLLFRHGVRAALHVQLALAAELAASIEHAEVAEVSAAWRLAFAVADGGADRARAVACDALARAREELERPLDNVDPLTLEFVGRARAHAFERVVAPRLRRAAAADDASSSSSSSRSGCSSEASGDEDDDDDDIGAVECSVCRESLPDSVCTACRRAFCTQCLGPPDGTVAQSHGSSLLDMDYSEPLHVELAAARLDPPPSPGVAAAEDDDDDDDDDDDGATTHNSSEAMCR